jgi:uncharacterized repeat protein (TIGR03803 family)
VILSSNTLYGTTSDDQEEGNGTVFRLDLAGSSYYPNPTGSLQVTITPPAAVTAGAQWRVDEGAWQNSGATVANLSGNYTVSFSTISSWITPPSQNVSVASNSTVVTTGIYLPAFNYMTNADGISITITGYIGSGGAVIIPSIINDLTVTSIGELAFYGELVNNPLTSITIPDTVTNIGEEAFEYQSSLTYVTIPEGVTSIGEYSFFGCGLTGATIPDSVTDIGLSAFAGCGSLTAITVDPENAFYSSLNGVLFDKPQSTLIEYPCGVGGSYTIPGGVTSIGEDAFADASVASVMIPDSVTNIGVGACERLTSATISESVTNIGDAAFNFCSSLTSVFFEGNTPSIVDTPTYSLPNLFDSANHATVYYLPGTTGWGSTFSGRPALLWKPSRSAPRPNHWPASTGSFEARFDPSRYHAKSRLTAKECRKSWMRGPR